MPQWDRGEGSPPHVGGADRRGHLCVIRRHDAPLVPILLCILNRSPPDGVLPPPHLGYLMGRGLAASERTDADKDARSFKGRVRSRHSGKGEH
jgi:hypothetical protein